MNSTKYISFQKLKPIWALAKENNCLYKHFLKLDSYLGRCTKQFKSLTPLPTQCSTFNESDFFRLSGHARSIYYKNSETNGVLAIKGGEPFAHDIDEKIKKMCDQVIMDNMHTLSETFLLIEQKIPMALMVNEALSEAQKAMTFQQAYFNRYNELALIPLPLYVFEIPTSISNQFLKKTRHYYSNRAQTIFDAINKNGLAVYVYYYPNPPVRVNTLQEDNFENLKSGGFIKLLNHLEKMTDPFSVVHSWITFVTRMLALRFFPCTLSHNEIGQMIRMQNAVIDGGFVDCDSIQSFSEIKSDREFIETSWLTLIELSMTIRAFLSGKSGYRKMSNHDLRILPTLIFSYMRDEFLKVMAKEKKNGTVFDPRIEKIMKSDSIKNELYSSLNTLFPG